MAARPYWRGQIRISLVSFPVALRSALLRASQIPLHEIDRDSGERIHHLNVTESGEEVSREDIIKSYDEGDTQVPLEPDEIKAIKLPSSDVLELSTFVDRADIPVARYERPYYVLPDSEGAEEIYAVIQQALADSGKVGIGQIAMRGREELCAVMAEKGGLMLEILRYDRELVDAEEVLPKAGSKKVKNDYVELANQLIEKNAAPPDFSGFHDRYHEALRELINAKKAHRKPNLPKAAKPSGEVVDFMDALRKSLDKKGESGKAPASRRRHASRRARPKSKASR